MNIRKRFFQSVLPSMLAFALSGVYAIVDGFFVGNSMGDSSLAAINLAYPLTALIQAIGTGIGMGGAIQYAICDGMKQEQKRNRSLRTSVWLLAAAGVLFTVVLLPCAPMVLRAFGAQGEILTLAWEYTRLIAMGTMFQVLGTGLVPFIRNMGSAVFAMSAMIAGFLSNILLDYLLVWVYEFGMAGAAAATVIGQAVTLLFCLCFLFVRRSGLRCTHEKGERGPAKSILMTALSPFGLTFAPNITLILVNKSAMIHGGENAVTGFATIGYISGVVFLLLQGISDGSQPLISLLYGQGDAANAKKVRNMAFQFAAATAGVCMAVLFLLRNRAAVLFGASEQVVRMVGGMLPLFLAGYLFVSFSRTAVSYFYATEKNRFASCLIYGEPVLLFLLLSVLPDIIGIFGTWLSVPLSQALAALASLVLLLSHKRPPSKERLPVLEGSEAKTGK
ncbi:MATE family efflux transporter [Candidatus Soleaferrea massiliensis]|uniref:MATE family efflux transporter n=1 Tax=Candidatus Soleaferrea massiliensis TaxID=1470354 RepID=UPI0006946135|nr:MATE family efflux transporter [Candidatus Soleaferrea massiliensis]